MQEISLIKNSFVSSTYKKHFHNSYSISLITKGECSLVIKGKSYSVGKGVVRIINPYELHEIRSSSWEHINLVLSAYFVRLILKDHKNSRIRFQNIIKNEKLSLDLQTLYSQKEPKNSGIKEILEYLAVRYTCKNLDENALHVERVKLQKAVSYIHQNANNCEINLDKIASHIGFSKYHLLREFKKEFGLTPYHYIQNIKINNARMMLNTEVPLSQIALECGFFDQSHLIKTYKKFFGHTPSKVRKQQ